MKNLLGILLLFFLTLSCKDQGKNDGGNEFAEFESSLDSLFNSQIKKDEPGAAVLVAYDGKMIIGKGYGLRDLETKEPITASTNMRMASVSKQFTALTILKLVDEGKIKLTDTVYNIIPYESFRDVTIEQLINHTSGREDAEEVFWREWDSTKIASNNDVLEWYGKENREVTKPGIEYRYNNGIYEFIPAIVEKVSGREFSVFAKEEIFERAGMENTQFLNLEQPAQIKEKANSYVKDSNGNWKKADTHFLDGLIGAGGLYTSVNDYFEYDQALRNKSLFSEETHKLIFKPSSTWEEEGEKKYYGMGWGIKDSVAEHTGGWIGTNTITIRRLKEPLTIAIFMNRNSLFEGDLIENTVSLVNSHIRTLKENEVTEITGSFE